MHLQESTASSPSKRPKMCSELRFPVNVFFSWNSLLVLYIFPARSCGSRLMWFCCGILWIFTPEHSFCCDIMWIFCFEHSLCCKIQWVLNILTLFCGEVRGILHPKFMFLQGILEILDRLFVLRWDFGDPGLDPIFLFCRGILKILDLD